MSAALDGHIRNVTARLNERVSRITNPHSRKAEVLMVIVKYVILHHMKLILLLT